MEDIVVQYTGFSPSQDTREHFDGLLNRLRDESPDHASIRAAIAKNANSYSGRIHGSVLCSADESESMLECISKHGIKVKTNPFYGLDKIENLVEVVHVGKIQGKAVIIVDQEQIGREMEVGPRF